MSAEPLSQAQAVHLEAPAFGVFVENDAARDAARLHVNESGAGVMSSRGRRSSAESLRRSDDQR